MNPVHAPELERGLAWLNTEVQRYGIRHPVVVDDDMRVWRAYGAPGSRR
jgi:hypothetical protein